MEPDAHQDNCENYPGIVSQKGGNTPDDIIDSLGEFAKDAQPHPVYSSYSNTFFIYEILSKEGWREKVSNLVDLWAENPDNIRRASAHVRRKPRVELIRGFCIFRLKAVDRQDWKEATSLGIGHEPQTVVFLALENLSPSNGFFMKLERGHDVCLDSRADVQFPPTGGGLGIFMALNI